MAARKTVKRPPSSIDNEKLEGLTSRELTVLIGIASGLHSKDISLAMGISVKTAEVHRYRLMKKLAIHDVAMLTRFAIRCGLIEP